MHALSPRFMPLLLVASIAACGPAPQGSAPAATSGTTPAAPTALASESNRLRMQIDGVEWRADRDFFGAIHPPGMNRAVLMAGSLGPKDANEQTFNLNLFGID
jgi:hypothetical protein